MFIGKGSAFSCRQDIWDRIKDNLSIVSNELHLFPLLPPILSSKEYSVHRMTLIDYPHTTTSRVSISGVKYQPDSQQTHKFLTKER